MVNSINQSSFNQIKNGKYLIGPWLLIAVYVVLLFLSLSACKHEIVESDQMKKAVGRKAVIRTDSVFHQSYAEYFNYDNQNKLNYYSIGSDLYTFEYPNASSIVCSKHQYYSNQIHLTKDSFSLNAQGYVGQCNNQTYVYDANGYLQHVLYQSNGQTTYKISFYWSVGNLMSIEYFYLYQDTFKVSTRTYFTYKPLPNHTPYFLDRSLLKNWAQVDKVDFNSGLFGKIPGNLPATITYHQNDITVSVMKIEYQLNNNGNPSEVQYDIYSAYKGDTADLTSTSTEQTRFYFSEW